MMQCLQRNACRCSLPCSSCPSVCVVGFSQYNTPWFSSDLCIEKEGAPMFVLGAWLALFSRLFSLSHLCLANSPDSGPRPVLFPSAIRTCVVKVNVECTARTESTACHHSVSDASGRAWTIVCSAKPWTHSCERFPSCLAFVCSDLCYIFVMFMMPPVLLVCQIVCLSFYFSCMFRVIVYVHGHELLKPFTSEAVLPPGSHSVPNRLLELDLPFCIV